MTMNLFVLARLARGRIAVNRQTVFQLPNALNLLSKASVIYFGFAFVSALFFAFVTGRNAVGFARIFMRPLWLLNIGTKSAGMALGAVYLEPHLTDGVILTLLSLAQVVAMIVLVFFALLKRPNTQSLPQKVATSGLLALSVHLATFQQVPKRRQAFPNHFQTPPMCGVLC